MEFLDRIDELSRLFVAKKSPFDAISLLWLDS